MTNIRIVRGGVCLLVILSGLALRRFGPGFGWPFPLVKYGGSILWAAMVFFLVATAAPQWPRACTVWISVAIALAVELFRLFHTSELDAFRLTGTGALLLGRVFSPWNLLAYSVGILAGACLDAYGASPVAKKWTHHVRDEK